MIIRNGQIVTEDRILRGDIAVKDQKIAEIKKQISNFKKAPQEIDAFGLHILPGMIDTHVHFNEPGRSEWEGFATGSRSLAAGGVTTFFDMPLNSNPPVASVEAFEKKDRCAAQGSIVDYYLWGGLLPDNFNRLEELNQCGVVGFKGFMSDSGIEEFPYLQDKDLLEGMEKVAEIGSILALHAESQIITQSLASGFISGGKTSIRDFVASRPVISEIEAVTRATAYAEITNCKLHILHVSSGEVVKRINQAKKRGLDITVETCPHYLSLNIEDFERLGTLAKCAPPLREQEHLESLWRALACGEIDIIGSDHSPSPPFMKEGGENQNVFNAWGGLSTAQSTLNILLEEGYFNRGVPLETIVRVTASNPARRFALYPRKGTIAVGSDADLTFVDLRKSFTLKKEDLLYKHPHSPYIGKKFRGTIMRTIVKGETVWEKEKQ